MLHQAACLVFGLLQQRGAGFINFFGGRRVQQFRHAERGFQFEVRPMVQRVAHRKGNRFCPFLELFPIGRILARAETFVDTVRPHGAPLVMVALQPDFREVFEPVIRGHVFGNQVAMVVDDRHFGRMLVVKTFRRRRLQQEVVVVELFHSGFY